MTVYRIEVLTLGGAWRGLSATEGDNENDALASYSAREYPAAERHIYGRNGADTRLMVCYPSSDTQGRARIDTAATFRAVRGI